MTYGKASLIMRENT